ncbi:MAG: NAD(P)H-dependent oxidoreductase subunit E [Bacteroidota bacterium]|nr:NAD(P)H-dependent oxidoreductase subunit E [Bacteroidota bacterium]
MFTEENLKKLEALKKQYPTSRALTLPALWLAQEQFGWLSKDTMKYVAEQISVPFNHVYSVASFYTMYNKKPVGKFHIQVCTNISCQLLDSEKMVEFICTKLVVKKNEITSDGKYSVSEVECLGSCGTAPVLQINDDYHEKLTAENIDLIIENLK